MTTVLTPTDAPAAPVDDIDAGTGLDVRPLAARIGAEIHGLDLAADLDGDVVEAIRTVLHRWKVVFFRGQRIGHAEQIAFGRRFGDLTYAHPHDDHPPEGHPEIYTVDPRRFTAQFNEAERTALRRRYSNTNGWHTDVTPAVNPPAASILRAEVVPAFGGDTTFTNLVAAYEGLAPPLRRLADELRARHTYGANLGALPGGSGGYAERIARNRLVAEHPVVRVHPVTGERALFVNPVFTSHIVDVSGPESRALLDLFFAQLARPAHTVRFRWDEGSVAFWDNRATAHLGPQDLDDVDVERVLHRVTLVGDVPVGPDGRESTLVEGVPFRSAPVFERTA